MAAKKQLSAKEREELLRTLQARFEKNVKRHHGIEWPDVLARLEKGPAKLWSLAQMESTGGEPDVIGRDEKSGEIIFCDCSVQSPSGRRSLCYDREAWESRKTAKPEGGNAVDTAKDMGIELLTETEYRELQQLGKFDTTTSSWIETPAEVRKLGGALFADRRYERVFVYHNGAESYYAARGFRGLLKV